MECHWIAQLLKVLGIQTLELPLKAKKMVMRALNSSLSWSVDPDQKDRLPGGEGMETVGMKAPSWS